jgi:hypothetical protein
MVSAFRAAHIPEVFLQLVMNRIVFAQDNRYLGPKEVRHSQTKYCLVSPILYD